MWRKLHSLHGLIGLVFVVALSLSGAILSVYPAIKGVAPEVQAGTVMSVADLVGNVSNHIQELDTLKRLPSGAIVASYLDGDGNFQEAYINAQTGDILHAVDPPGQLYVFTKDFHRSFLLGETGRIVSGFGALLMVMLSISGVFLLVSRMGGWSHILDNPKGNWSQRYHTILTRLLIIPLVISSLTGIYIVLAEFEIIPVTNAESLDFPQSTQDLPAVPYGTLHALGEIPLSELISLKYPLAGDTADVFTATTTNGLTLIDQFTGDALEQVPVTTSGEIYNWIYAMHTGEGMAWVGLILGVAALFVPVLGTTGVVIWWKRTRGNNQKIKGNQPASIADIIVLVGSEGGATWGFAKSLHRDLSAAGHKVHVAPMNAFNNQYPMARLVLFLASTYGNGSAPASANKFPLLLADLPTIPVWSYAVLGFGDRAFPHFCKFAKDMDAEMYNHGWKRCLPPTFINRQSTQAFASWGVELAAATGGSFTLSHKIELPQTRKLVLVERRHYGEKVQAPTAVLKFRYEPESEPSFWDKMLGRDGKRPRFAPSDLLGILPPSSEVPRYYSVSSGPSDNEVEICVRKQRGGECSTFLHELAIGGEINCFVKINPDFRPVAGKKPIIMVGAGTGIAPFMGMVRANHRLRPIHLFWGGRDPDSDYLYKEEMDRFLLEKHLASYKTAFSRVLERSYVQDRLREESTNLCEMVRRGASIMVCGGDAMAQSAAREFDVILMPLGINVLQLKQRGLYLEDIF